MSFTASFRRFPLVRPSWSTSLFSSCLSLPFSRLPLWGLLRVPSLVRGFYFLVCLYSSSLCFSHAWFLRVPFLWPWLQPFSVVLFFSPVRPLCIAVPSFGFSRWCLSLPLPCESTLHLLSIYWVLGGLPLPHLFLILPSLVRGLLPFLSSVLSSWVLLILGVRARGTCPPLWGPILGVHLSCLCSLCVLYSSSGFGGGWLWCWLWFHFWSFALLDFSFLLLCLLAFSGSLLFQLGGE